MSEREWEMLRKLEKDSGGRVLIALRRWRSVLRPNGVTRLFLLGYDEGARSTDAYQEGFEEGRLQGARQIVAAQEKYLDGLLKLRREDEADELRGVLDEFRRGTGDGR